MRKQKNKFIFAPLYQDTTTLLQMSISLLKNFDKDTKGIFRDCWMQPILELIRLQRKVYDTKDITKKSLFVDNLIDQLEDIKVISKVLSDTRQISPKQYAQLVLQLGCIDKQCELWRKSINKLQDTQANPMAEG